MEAEDINMSGEEARKVIHDFLSNFLPPGNQFFEAYKNLRSDLDASKRQRLNASKFARVTYTNTVPTIGRFEIPSSGRLKECKFFECDGTPDSKTIVLQTSLMLIRGEKDELSICTLFASALAAHLPSLTNKLKTTLIGIGVELKVVYLPKQADESAVEVVWNKEFDVCDAHLVMGACICLLFKNIDEKSYAKFLSDLFSLARKLGMPREKVAAVSLPVTLRQAACIRRRLGFCLDLKKELLLHLMNIADGGRYAGAAARYVCLMLSWSEMTHFGFVYEKLWSTNSPVLKDPRVWLEVKRFTFSANEVARCPYPQFFRYFCTWDQEQLVSRNRFPILAAVAQRLKNAESSNPTTANFVGTLSENEAIVACLVKKHNDYLDKVTMGKLKASKFITNDTGVGGFNDEDES